MVGKNVTFFMRSWYVAVNLFSDIPVVSITLWW